MRKRRGCHPTPGRVYPHRLQHRARIPGQHGGRVDRCRYCLDPRYWRLVHQNRSNLHTLRWSGSSRLTDATYREMPVIRAG